MDLAALGFALGGSTGRTAVAGALGFVAAQLRWTYGLLAGSTGRRANIPRS